MKLIQGHRLRAKSQLQQVCHEPRERFAQTDGNKRVQSQWHRRTEHVRSNGCRHVERDLPPLASQLDVPSPPESARDCNEPTLALTGTCWTDLGHSGAGQTSLPSRNQSLVQVQNQCGLGFRPSRRKKRPEDIETKLLLASHFLTGDRPSSNTPRQGGEPPQKTESIPYLLR